MTTLDMIELDFPNFYYLEYDFSLADNEVVRRAMEFVGETREYNLINNSCESLSSYCKSGTEINGQANFATKVGIGIVAVGAAALAAAALLKASKEKQSQRQ